MSAQVRPARRGAAKARSDMEYGERCPTSGRRSPFSVAPSPAAIHGDRIRVTGTRAVTDPTLTVTMQQTSQLRIYTGPNIVSKIYSENKI